MKCKSWPIFYGENLSSALTCLAFLLMDPGREGEKVPTHKRAAAVSGSHLTFQKVDALQEVHSCSIALRDKHS